MKNSARETTIRGVVQSFNISPRGVYEGMLVESSGGLVQVNFEPEAGAYISNHFAEGKKVSLIAVPEGKSDKGKPQHPVYQLLRFADGRKGEINFSQEEERVETEGKIKRLNYALHGEVNGAILDNGDFVHMKPEGAKIIELKVGQKLKVQGETSPSYLSHRIIEAEKVNGMGIRKKHK